MVVARVAALEAVGTSNKGVKAKAEVLARAPEVVEVENTNES